jgi:hypothetical protein
MPQRCLTTRIHITLLVLTLWKRFRLIQEHKVVRPDLAGSFTLNGLLKSANVILTLAKRSPTGGCCGVDMQINVPRKTQQKGKHGGQLQI